MEQLRRSASAGRNKPRPQIGAGTKALPNISCPREGKMYNFVVCGPYDAESAADAAMFSDFMGISMTLRYATQDAEGTYLSCFPLDELFDQLAMRNPPITDIKWGKFGPNRTPLYTYSKTQWVTRSDKWFEYVHPKDILEKVTTWIQYKAHGVAENDVVNIFFQTHGDVNGNVCLGTKRLTTSAVVDLISQFPRGCQVNVVGSHCYSGKLVNAIRASGQIARYAVAACGPEEKHFSATRSVSNRIRNFRFSQPFIQSLARVHLPWLPQQGSPQLTIAQYDNFLREAMRRMTLTSFLGRQAETYTSYLSPEIQASVTLLEELVLRDHVDVVFLRETAHRRRRLEWPTLDVRLMQQMRRNMVPPSSSLVRRIQDHIQSAASKCDFDSALMDDGPILGRLERRQPPYAEILRALYYRGRVQSAVWDVFLILCERGFLDLETSLEHPINFYTAPHGFSQVVSLLLCFEGPYEANLLAPYNFNYSLSFPIHWLAVMISRGCADPARLFETIRYTGMLGPLLDTELHALLSQNDGVVTFNCDPKMRSGYSPPPFGLWLPHGVGNNPSLIPDIIVKSIAFFNETEALFKELFGLSDEELLLEPQQFLATQV
ncbi:hypothetical protein McanMca71_001415 [Microsporum canis]|uniref:Uncharacterized protein n=1 Tax=Arthroderma otae (strain ATCC MYA-4605 / CBS 113480) TaxID=554155 RepID=C5FU44_ARTOC|nr:uncharacterized protein MCYG_06247 [Microsporum canis CBS 113480]EEQ33428.1 predicted protein [Microsporum canis CBS 113480]